MKKLISIILAVAIFMSLAVTVSAAMPSLPTTVFEGKTYYRVNTKAEYTALVNYAISNLLEEIPIYREPSKTNYDSSWSNDVGNFCDYKSYRELKFLDYNTNTVSGYCNQKPIYDDLNCFVDFTNEAYGALQIQYTDNREEIKKAEAIINDVLAKVKGKTEVEKIEYIVNYICSVTKSGSIVMPGGGYDLINGVYDVLTGHHTNVVCTSYTVTLQKFLEVAGIESVMIHNSNHIWNMVCLDGVWYGIDVTAGDLGNTMSDSFMLMGYDRLKGFDDSQTPIATFKTRHNLAEKGYYSKVGGGSNTVGSTSSQPPKKDPSNVSSKPISTVKPETATSSDSVLSFVELPSETESSFSSTQDVESKPENNSDAPSNTVTIVVTENALVSAEVFKDAEEKGEKISLVGDGFVWKFDAGKLDDNVSVESFNAEVFVGDSVPLAAVQQLQKVEEIETKKIFPFSFSHHGKLPGEAEITIKVTPEFKGKTVYIYYLDDESGKPVRAGKGIVSEEDTLTFTTDHCSVWFLSEERLPSDNSLGLILIIIGAAVFLSAGAVTTVLLIKRKRK